MMILLDLLKRTFANKYIDDDRLPIVSLSVLNRDVEILAPSVSFSLLIIWILFLQMMTGALMATVIYYWILPDTTNSSTPQLSKDRSSFSSSSSSLSSFSSKHRAITMTSTQGFIIGFGIIIPIALALPFALVDYCDIRNSGFRLALVSLPMTVTLRVIEAVFGFVPGMRRQTLWEYVMYVSFIMQPKYDRHTVKTVAATAQTTLATLKAYMFWLSIFTIIYHSLSPIGFTPFSKVTGIDHDWDDRIVQWDLGHIYNTFVQACMTSVTLALAMTGVSCLGSILTGVQMDEQVTNYPMFLSESVSDFWGRRWNNLIHVALKQGIYKPVRYVTRNKICASIAAFVVSGLYHEYVWGLLFLSTTAQQFEAAAVGADCCPSCYCKTWVGKQLLFFGWNGVLIALEYVLGEHLAKITFWMPRLVRSHLIVLLSLPVGHLFTGDLTRAGYFLHLRHAIPIVTVSHHV
jgi:hypothetical protein